MGGGRQARDQTQSAVFRLRQQSMAWIDRIPLPLLIGVAVWMAIAPITPEPHLLEKLRMLSQATLVQALDIFDLLMHSTPMLVLFVRLWRQFLKPSSQGKP